MMSITVLRMVVLVGWLALTAQALSDDAGDSKAQESTLESLFKNVLSYAIVVVPAVFVIRHLQNNPEKISAFPGSLSSIVRACVEGALEEGDEEKGEVKPARAEAVTEPEEPMAKQALRLAFHVAGLQGSYLTWGVLQEHVMTQAYGETPEGEPVRWTNSQFLVFMNRILALVVATAWCRFTTQPPHRAPLFKYSFPSMSNIMSSWCQYVTSPPPPPSLFFCSFFILHNALLVFLSSFFTFLFFPALFIIPPPSFLSLFISLI